MTRSEPIQSAQADRRSSGAAEPAQHDAASEDRQLVEALRRGEEAAFAALLTRYHQSMLRLALIYVPDRAAAEEVVQESWLGLLESLPRFEGRSSLKTWLFRILTNRARTRARREGRSVPFSALGDPGAGPDEPSVEPERFLPLNHPRWPRHWAAPPPDWETLPEARLLAQETRAHLRQAIAALPPGQRTVLTLRDVEGWDAGEVCNVLGLTETNQRVLLHRARSRVRRELERYLTAE